MTGGSTIVEFWRDHEKSANDASREEDVSPEDQSLFDMEEDEAAPTRADRALRRARLAFSILGAVWLAFAIWAGLSSGQWRAGPAAWPAMVATALIPLILLGVCYILLIRNSRTESRRYLHTAQALRTEADLLELRLGRIANQLETARQTMQDQAELLDSYGAAASSNMEASAELIASRAQSTVRDAESAEKASEALVTRLTALIDAMPDLEDRAGRMAARIVDDGHALSERIDALEARLQALGELSDDARARTLSATKSLSSQLLQVQEATRSASEEMTGIADIASARLDATMHSARAATDENRQAIEQQAAAMESLIQNVRQGIVTVSQTTRASFAEEMEATTTDLQQRIGQTLGHLQHVMASASEGLDSQKSSLEDLLDRSRIGIAATGQAALVTMSNSISAIEADLRQRMEATQAQIQATLTECDARLSDQAATLDSLVTQSRTSIESIGGETVSALTDNMSEIENRLHQINGLVEDQRTLMTNLHGQLGDTLAAAEERFGALEQSSIARTERLTGALSSLTAETQRIDNALASGGVTAEKLIACAETLLVALDSSVRELDETYPAALERFEGRMERSRAVMESTTPELERLEAISEALLGRTQEAEELLRGQGSRLTEWLESTQGGLESNRELVNRLRLALDGAHQDATRITEGAGPLLVTALLRVKDTADQAAERARQALGRAIPDAAQALAEASEEAMERVVGDRVTAQIQQLSRVAEEAVKAAHQASERLMRQLLTIADTSANVEQRIEHAERAAEERDRDHFARRSALLIESLNSTAIDVAKILSNDVTDSAWSSYLKGDRGVFTRRAVKLLDAGESREIALHYDEDAEFRDHVNRYIHDFESMLRIILSARDGNALGVAILSSDMGKLYVALAQAIERLRQ
ncbi:hypothetical protein [Sphingobium cloacae]|uniref:ATPase n=1 Tax=Sphingobium cloacae TaxID=120107 RepID=A0A1E1F101_9SPHN|nr:hypothetical protein [Sphingobium cloacae]BAV64187.1 hypothetical protein SCLO_1011470 [Sphingobium cloacae]